MDPDPIGAEELDALGRVDYARYRMFEAAGITPR